MEKTAPDGANIQTDIQTSRHPDIPTWDSINESAQWGRFSERKKKKNLVLTQSFLDVIKTNSYQILT